MKFRFFFITATLAFGSILPLFAGDDLSHGKEPLVIDDENPFGDKITGDWGGSRLDLLEHGLQLNFDTTYSYQNVADGGVLRAGNASGHVGSANLGIILDTGKAGFWPGGFLTVRGEGRASDPVLLRAGATSPVNNDALLPLVPGRTGSDAFALSELTYAQFLSERFGIVLGLINTDTGDTNPIAGHVGSNQYFMNMGFLYSNSTVALVPTATLGGGLVILPDENNQIKLLAVGSEETAGFNPFDRYDGTTFIVEWATEYEAFDKPAGMTFSGYYGVDQDKRNIAADPRVLVQSVLGGSRFPPRDETWALSWNGFQYLSGDETRGWGLFGRAGISDPENVINWNVAGGIGGVGAFSARPQDRWGVGVYRHDFNDSGILPILGIDSETGAEIFYSIAVCRGVDVTLDLQVVDSALPLIDDAVVGGVRVRMDW
jgi:porin